MNDSQFLFWETPAKFPNCMQYCFSFVIKIKKSQQIPVSISFFHELVATEKQSFFTNHDSKDNFIPLAQFQNYMIFLYYLPQLLLLCLAVLCDWHWSQSANENTQKLSDFWNDTRDRSRCSINPARPHLHSATLSRSISFYLEISSMKEKMKD